MFWNSKAMKKVLENNEKLATRNNDLESECIALTDEKRKLNGDVEDLKLKTKIGEEDIKHMVKMKEEVMGLEKEKYKVKVDGEKSKEIAKVKDEHQEKLQTILEKQIDDGEKRFKEILSRLPTTTVRLKGEV